MLRLWLAMGLVAVGDAGKVCDATCTRQVLRRDILETYASVTAKGYPLVRR